MTRRLLTTILVPLFLAACGVALEQSSLPQTSAPDIIPETETAAAADSWSSVAWSGTTLAIACVSSEATEASSSATASLPGTPV